MNFTPIPGTEASLAESPVWDERQGALLWTDIPAGTIHELTLATGARRKWVLAGPVGSFGLCEDGRLIVARREEVGVLDRDSGDYTPLARLLPEGAAQRLNDGKPGPDGAFWVGAMDDTPQKRPIAALYRVDGAGRVEVKRAGLITSNGLAFAPDGRALYHSDSRGCWIERYDLDPHNGALTGQTRIATPQEADGRPDGATIDAEGCYWSAGVSAGCLNRYAPTGTLIARYPVPVPAPTMPCFGGPGLRTLFITSLSHAAGGTGQVLSAPAPVAGIAAWRFAGRAK
ncbi:SMP-30/gluconolactonase/LRE family protein [Acidocella sp.]|uniref:SMP-30/gluconolactonase/LRE family protein n=1 Tax=Acidocella sp. TaxID=50710 RepID=UPI00262B43E1|nr:SMP-30/gluconolactonase/LRE family protein [Acidocella sp.]